MVCKWAWVSIPRERDLPKSLNWCSPLELRSHALVRTHANTQASARTYSLLSWHRSTAIAHTKEPSLPECIIYLMRIPTGPRFTKGRLNQVAVHNRDRRTCFQLQFWSWYNAIMKATFTPWKLRKALDLESNRCTAGSLLSMKPKGLLVYVKLSLWLSSLDKPQNNDFNSYIYILYYQSNMHYYSIPN